MTEKAREFGRYFHHAMVSFHTKYCCTTSSLQSLESPLTTWNQVENEIIAIRGLLAGFNSRLERLESLLMAMPFPPRDVVREKHVLNAIAPENIISALHRLSRSSTLPNGMKFSHAELTELKEDIERQNARMPVIQQEDETI